jgi:hypothetical protein
MSRPSIGKNNLCKCYFRRNWQGGNRRWARVDEHGVYGFYAYFPNSGLRLTLEQVPERWVASRDSIRGDVQEYLLLCRAV